MMFIDFHTLVIRDGLDRVNVPRELKINEFRYRVSL